MPMIIDAYEINGEVLASFSACQDFDQAIPTAGLGSGSAPAACGPSVCVGDSGYRRSVTMADTPTNNASPQITKKYHGIGDKTRSLIVSDKLRVPPCVQSALVVRGQIFAQRRQNSPSMPPAFSG